MSHQKCTVCDNPSIPGLHKGHGKCQYHWNVGAFGKVWADECEKRETLNKKRDKDHAQEIDGLEKD